MNVNTETATDATSTDTDWVDEFIAEQQAHVHATARVMWSILTGLGLLGIAGIISTGRVNGLLIVVSVLTGIAASRVLRAHDKLNAS